MEKFASKHIVVLLALSGGCEVTLESPSQQTAGSKINYTFSTIFGQLLKEKKIKKFFH